MVRNVIKVEKIEPDHIPAMINVHPIEDALHLRAEETVRRDEVALVLQRLVLLVWKIGEKNLFIFYSQEYRGCRCGINL